MIEKPFICRPASRQSSFEIAAKFGDELEGKRSETLFLPERSRLISLLATAIENGEIKLIAFVRSNTPDLANVSASLTSALLKSDGAALEPKTTSATIDSSWIEIPDVPTVRIPVSSVTN